MGVVMCIRCDRRVCLDTNVEGAYCDDQIPGLTKTGNDWVCDNCLTDEEWDKLEKKEAEPAPVRKEK